MKCLIKILLDYFESIFVSIILQKMCRSILIIVVFDEYQVLEVCQREEPKI